VRGTVKCCPCESDKALGKERHVLFQARVNRPFPRCGHSVFVALITLSFEFAGTIRINSLRASVAGQGTTRHAVARLYCRSVTGRNEHHHSAYRDAHIDHALKEGEQVMVLIRFDRAVDIAGCFLSCSGKSWVTSEVVRVLSSLSDGWCGYSESPSDDP
jgi:hypothetical protein